MPNSQTVYTSSMKTTLKPGRKPDPNSKRQTGKERNLHPRKAFHAPAPLFDALDRYIRETTPQPSEAAVMREALAVYLRGKGYKT